MGLVQIFHENLQFCLTMVPNDKDIIHVSPPDEGLDAGIVQKPSFKLSHEEVGIGGGHSCAHCCAVDVEVVLFSKEECILVQDLGDQLCQVWCWWCPGRFGVESLNTCSNPLLVKGC